jgi:hypothetical protein
MDEKRKARKLQEIAKAGGFVKYLEDRAEFWKRASCSDKASDYAAYAEAAKTLAERGE